jgi:hypothetical protein
VPTLQAVGGSGDRLHQSACYHEAAVLQAISTVEAPL